VLSSAFQKAIESLIDKYKIPGLSISVLRKEEGQWAQGVTTWGIRDKTGSRWEADVSCPPYLTVGLLTCL
jgi:hypothetical protein